MTSVDYYEVLEIERSANHEEIKRSYKRLAFEYHPDRNPDNTQAEDKFKEINEAYQILSDPDKRARYDSFGHISSDGMFSDQDFGGGGFNDIFGNLFEEVFNAGRTRAQKGRDLRYGLEITFEESIEGSEKELKIPKHTLCPDCDGSGAAPGGETVCIDCGGRGELTYSQGFLAIKRACPSCSGTGKQITKRCPNCRGEKLIKTEHNVKVKIPAGITDESRLRIRGEGEIGFYGGPEGDLYIEINVQEHPLFKRDREDLYCEIPISFVKAALGDEIEIPTPKGKSTIQIPAGTQSGQTFRLKGKGAPRLNGRGVGDLYIETNVEIPVKLNKKQKQILEEFSQACEEENDPLSKRFFDKLNQLFGKQSENS
ncbi:MAG: molecular chaperone DnaJ [Thermodesulfobacteriota bacterium]